MDEKIERIKQFYKLIENDPKNEFFLFPFMELVIEQLLDFKLISDKGMIILSRDINEDMKNLHNKKSVNKSRLWVCLYFMCVYHLSKCYVSFMEVMMNATEGKYEELRVELFQEDEEILTKLINVKERIFTFIQLSKIILDTETAKITDDHQAKLFDEHKRKCIDKVNYFPESTIYCPAEIPNGVEVI
jgi:uncharacterized membrane protein